MNNTKAKSVNSLYNLSISKITKHFRCFEDDLNVLPGSILFDVYYTMYKTSSNMLNRLYNELLDIDRFYRIMKVTKKRILLLELFQSLMDHDMTTADLLKQSYADKCQNAQETPSLLEPTIIMGLRLGTFLSEAGWFVESKGVLELCLKMCLSVEPTALALRRTLECYHKLLHSNWQYRDFHGAAECFQKALALKDKLSEINEVPNLAGLYAEFSAYFFVRSDYDKAYHWSIEALRQLVPGLPTSIVIIVLRKVARACVIKRQFHKAEIMIIQAISLAFHEYEESDPRIADTLNDYGFFLMNSDNIEHCVSVHLKALKIKQSIFGKSNLYVAFLLEDLAYAMYVSEYHTDTEFPQARKITERTIDIMQKLLPPDHLLHASLKRVKALIMEEIVLDSRDDNLLPSVEKVHLECLRLTLQAFGVWNVQTAKHYGNLGRLYQTMQKYKVAEKMQLKAIYIKEHLLGEDDYEVALSVGHLASLYNYGTGEYRKAEALYLRSIKINRNLFGSTYSGLHYDYRGLLNVYDKLEDYEKLAEYTFKLEQWGRLREQNNRDDFPTTTRDNPLPLAEVIKSFFQDD